MDPIKFSNVIQSFQDQEGWKELLTEIIQGVPKKTIAPLLTVISYFQDSFLFYQIIDNILFSGWQRQTETA